MPPLELDSTAQLNSPRPVERLRKRKAIRVIEELCCDHPEVRRIFKIRGRVKEIRMVEDEEVDRDCEVIRSPIFVLLP
jgi:hypothetical protein